MRIVAISDLHGYLPNNLPECDVICICGDIFPVEIDKNIIRCITWISTKFKTWCDKQNCDKIIIIWGNHDFLGEEIYNNDNYKFSDLGLGQKVVLLNDSEYLYKDIKFYGSPWCPNLNNWAFYGDNNTLINKFNNIPDCDVLLTHCPPKIKNYGTILEKGYNHMTDFGSNELTESITDKNILLHLFGHIHSGSHVPELINNTVFCNVSLRDEKYKVSYNYKIFEISNNTVFRIEESLIYIE